MSLIKSIRQQLGLSVTPANNFTLDASANNGTMKLARNSGQDIMTVDAAGKVGFSVGILGFAFSFGAAQSYVKFPSWLNGFCVQWGEYTIGSVTTGSYNGALLTLPLTLANVSGAVAIGSLAGINTAPGNNLVASARVTSTTQFELTMLSSVSYANQSIDWVVIGRAA